MIEILCFDGCPNQEPTFELVREVVAEEARALGPTLAVGQAGEFFRPLAHSAGGVEQAPGALNIRVQSDIQHLKRKTIDPVQRRVRLTALRPKPITPKRLPFLSNIRPSAWSSKPVRPTRVTSAVVILTV